MSLLQFLERWQSPDSSLERTEISHIVFVKSVLQIIFWLHLLLSCFMKEMIEVCHVARLLFLNEFLKLVDLHGMAIV